MKSFVGDIHAVHVIARSPSHLQGLFGVVQHIMDAELVVIPGEPPDAQWREHIESVLQYTLLRPIELTRGCLVRHSLVGGGQAHIYDDVEDTCQLDNRRRVGEEVLLKLLNVISAVAS